MSGLLGEGVLEQTGQIVEMRIIKPIKVSTLHAKAERYRDGFVKLFREYEHADLLNEDGTPMLDGAGRRVFLTAARFAREMGLPKQTFHQWVNGRSVRNADPTPDDRAADEGWDLPGVPQETVDKIRENVEHNEALLADPEWREANGMEPEPSLSAKVFGGEPALFVGGIARALNVLANDLHGIKGRVPRRELDALRTALARVGAQITRLDQS